MHAGSLELDLTSLPMPAKRVRSCTLDTLSTASKLSASSGRTASKKVSLFEQKRLRGFWPVVAESNGQQILAVSQRTDLVTVRAVATDCIVFVRVLFLC